MVRALLLVMAVMLAVNTRGRLGVVHHYGVSPGISPVVGTGILAVVAYPVPLVAFLAVFVRSAYLVLVRRRVTWKGRDISPSA